MDLAAAFYISVYCLAGLAGGILAWAEYMPSVTMLTPPIAIALLFLNERQRIFRMDGGWVAVAGIAAFAFPAIEFFRGDEEFRLLAGAHLMVILQWVLLAYNKTAHQYWWVCALSCLQVAVAAVLTTSPIFGIFILIYMFWALWTLSLFTLLLARLRFGRNDPTTGRTSAWQWPQLDRSTSDLNTAQPASETLITGPREHKQRNRSREVSEFRGTFQCEPHETDLNWRFVLGITGMSIVALTLGMILFLVTPRVWVGPVNNLQENSSIAGRSRRMTGFSETVRLNDFGKILESSAPVMELTLFDDESDAALSLTEAIRQIGQDEALLRGAALALYDRGQWTPFENRMARDIPLGPTNFNPQPKALIRQEIRLSPLGTNTLFTLGRPIYLKVERPEGRARMQIHTGSISLAVTGGLLSPGTNYTAWSLKRPPAKRGGGQAATQFAKEYRTCPPNLQILISETNRILEPLRKNAGNRPLGRAEIAQALVAYLRDSGQFGYSLDRTVMNPDLDPIEDFLINRKQGHCQYFAAALALMLRVEDIPTCVITGFKGGLEDPERNVIEIQQRHAHAWVEAYIDGQWVTLDPTPSDERDDFVAAVGDRLRIWHQISAAGTLFWNEYVLNLSFSKQQQDLYGPMQELFQYAVSGQANGANLWETLAENLKQFLLHPDRWFSWQGGLVAFVLMLLIVGAAYLVKGLRALARTFGRRAGLIRCDKFQVEFHSRFLALIKPFGLIPSPAETQREFAARVIDEWELHGLPVTLKPLAWEIAQAFDGLRFGNQPLSETAKTDLLAALNQLESHCQTLRAA